MNFLHQGLLASSLKAKHDLIFLMFLTDFYTSAEIFILWMWKKQIHSQGINTCWMPVQQNKPTTFHQEKHQFSSHVWIKSAFGAKVLAFHSSTSPRAIAVLELQILYTPAGRNLIKNASQAHKFSNTPHHRRRGGREGGGVKKQK